jgi:hypothetical protein
MSDLLLIDDELGQLVIMTAESGTGKELVARAPTSAREARGVPAQRGPRRAGRVG